MVLMPVRCLYCQSDQVTKRGKTAQGKQRYRCHNLECTHQSFLCDRSCTWTLRINAAGHLSAVMQTSQRPRSHRSRHKARSWCLFDLTSLAVRTQRV